MIFTDFNLDPRLQRNVQAMGFEQPTPIQDATIPAALTGQDILGSAETGTGKTAAYLLPILQRLISTSDRPRSPRVLILVPTRELALQVADHAVQLSKGTPVRVAAIFGGVSLVNQEQALRRGVDIVIEMLANVNLSNDLKILAKNGRVIVVGNRGAIKIDPREMMARDSAIIGMTLFNASQADLKIIHAGLGAGLSNNTLRPVVGKKISLKDAAQAHREVMKKGAYGKIVLIP